MPITNDTITPRSAFGDEIVAMLRLSWPLILTNVAQTAMTATDVMMLGWLGPDSLAAGALGTNLYFSLMIFGLGLVLAVSPMMARELGENRFAVRELRRTFRQGLWAAVSVSVPLWIVLWNTESLLLAMGQNPALSKAAGTYMHMLQWSVLPFYFYIVLRSFISALERPGWGLTVGIIAVLFNALANWCLIFGNYGFPATGMAGSGLATALSSLVMFLGLALVVSLDRRFKRYHLFGRFWRPDWQRYRQMWQLGLPIGAILVFEVVLFAGAALVMGLIDEASLAAHAIAIQIASVAFMVPMGFGQAATVRIGRAFGSGDTQGIRRSGVVAFWMVIAFMSFTATMMITFPQVLIGVFIDVAKPENAVVAGLAVSFLFYAALFQLVDGAQAVAIGMLRGLHDTKVPMILAAFSYWAVGMPLGIWLAFGAGLKGAGIWIGLSGGLAVVAVLLLLRWHRRHVLGLERIGPNTQTAP
jgi:multidrug resistance protein, MATE family